MLNFLFNLLRILLMYKVILLILCITNCFTVIDDGSVLLKTFSLFTAILTGATFMIKLYELDEYFRSK